MSRLTDDLNALHDSYIESINVAITADDLDRAHSLAAEYDDEAIEMITRHDGPTDLLPLHRPARVDTSLRARIRRLTRPRAA